MNLPDLILFNDFKGNWEQYLGILYFYFRQDFEIDGIEYKHRKVFYIKTPVYRGKEFSFWHMITEGKIESERLVDIRRCERIRWPKAIIENNEDRDVKSWISQRKNKKGKIQRRICFCFGDFDYFVVLDIRKNYYLFCTAYPVYNHRKKKIREDYFNYKQTPPF
jgi:hypothetical protein